MLKPSAHGTCVWLLLTLILGCSEAVQPVSSTGQGGTTTSVRATGGTSPTSIEGSGGASTSKSHDSGTMLATGGTDTTRPAARVLVFSRTAGYRHTSIESGVAALEGLAQQHEFSLTATENASVFSESGLAPYDVVLFLSTTGDVLDAGQQLAFESFIRSGRGYVGVHAASDTEYDWPWYGGLVGAYFRDHPDVQSASILVEDSDHPATAHLPASWTRRDEWYAFRENPRERVEVLLCLDESTYDHAVGSMGEDHPIAWYHEYDGGRAFYTGLGHTEESYQEPAFLEHLWGAIRWAARW